MSQIFLFILILIATLAIALKKYRFAFLTGLMNLILFILIGSGILPGFLLNQLQIHAALSKPIWKQNNVIVLLGSGSISWPENKHLSSQSSAYSRIFEAARLYQNCKKHSANCRIIATGGDPGHNGISEAEIIHKELSAINIPADDIITETQSLNTFQNAEFTSQMLQKENFDQIILVTSGTHMLRALKAFSYFNVSLIPAPSDHLKIKTSWKHLYQNFYFNDLSLHEIIGYAKMWLSQVETTKAN